MATRARRQFLIDAGLASAGAALSTLSARAMISSAVLSLGLQLYSVREMLARDFEGTLKQIAALGYREVEAAGFYGHSPAQVKAAMSAAGLACVSAHFSSEDLNKSCDDVIAFGQALGLQYIICSFPAIKYPSRLKDSSYRTQAEAFNLEDYRWNAQRFNAWGRKVKAAGMQFGYHNHARDFGPQDGVVPFDELARNTDPQLVTFEMDCGWVVVGGGDPEACLRRYPTRISMLHVKDFKRSDKPVTETNPPPATELGRGTIDYKRIFAAARKASVRHYFVEQEEYDMPPLEALKIDADYMRNLRT
jgi:sugar phosphate isomerase/epimerase